MLITILYLIVIFSNLILQLFPWFSFADEVLTFVILGIGLFYSTKVNYLFNKWDIRILLGIFALTVLGLFETFIFKVNTDIVCIIKDIVLFSKIFLVYVFSKPILYCASTNGNTAKNIYIVSSVTLSLIFVFGVISLFFNIGMGDEVRNGIRSYKFLYSHYTYLVYAIVILISYLLYYLNFSKKSYKYLLMSFISLALTMRSKAFISISLIFVIFLFKKYNLRIKFSTFLLLFVIAFAITFGKIQEYFSWGYTSMRTALHLVGFEIAYDKFPFGYGLGAFGSNLSFEFNSQVYDIYGLLNSDAFTLNNAVISDVFWPYIFGQWGYLGVVIYCGMLFAIYKSLKYSFGKNKKLFYSMLIPIFYLLISSAVEATFTNETGVFTVSLVALIMPMINKKVEQSKIKTRINQNIRLLNLHQQNNLS